MTLSSDGSVTWRLNDLLAADRKAKAYADVGWSDAAGKSPAGIAESFKEWTPILVEANSDEIEEEDKDEALESLEGEASIEQADSEEILSEQSEETTREDEAHSALDEEAEAAKYAEEALQAAKKEAHDAGYEKGREEATANFQKSKDSFEAMVASLRVAQNDMNEFYQPLKKLALHLAQQLVRGELSLSSSAIERLTKAALEDIEGQGEGPIIISMHPLDRDHFGEELYDEYSGIELRSDRALSQGSIRISIDDSAIEDLIEQRLSHLAQQVLGLSAEITSSMDSSAEFTNQVEERVLEGSSLSTDESDPTAALQTNQELDVEDVIVADENDHGELDGVISDMAHEDPSVAIEQQAVDLEMNQDA